VRLLETGGSLPSNRPDASHKPETLEDAWAVALACDQRLQASRWIVSSARQSLGAAKAQRQPVLGAEGSYTARSAEPGLRVNLPGLPLPTEVFPLQQNEDFAFRTKVDVPLYTSGRIAHGIAAAEAEAAAAALDVEETATEVMLHVGEAYVSVLRALREVEVARSTVESLESHARNVELLFKHQRVPRNDLLAAQVALSHARHRRIEALNLLDFAQAAYNRQLGRPLTSPVRLTELAPESMEADVESLTDRALTLRPSLERLGRQIQSLQEQAYSVRAKNGPQVFVRGEYVYEENRYRSPEGVVAAGVGVTWNLFDGGRNSYEACALLQRAESLVRLKADRESRIGLEVRGAWLNVQEAHQRLEVTPEAIGQAEENLRVARTRYAQSMGTNTEVLDAQTLRTQAFRDHHNATCDAVLAVLRLRYATGELRP
jgi:outer membrane protein TolC